MKVRIKDIAEVINGSTPSTEHPEYYDGNIIWITPKDLSDQNSKYISRGERSITQAGYNSCSTKMIPESNILMSSRAPIGLLSINKVECCTNQGFKNLIADKTKCSIEYLYYYLKYHIKEIESLGSGTTFKEVSKDSMEKYEIELPSIEDQVKISTILTLLDDKIINNMKINMELESMAKTLYDYWFLQFEFPNEKRMPYKSSGGKMVWNEELKREIPEGWEVKAIHDIADLYQPETISESDLVKNGEYHVYGANGIIGKYNKFNHKDNEIAVTCRGASCGNILMTLPNSWITGNAMVFTPKIFFLHKEYVYYSLNKKVIQRYITGSAQPQITRTNLSGMKIIIPTENILVKFEMIANLHRAKIINILLENQDLTSLRDFLLPLLMNGQVSFRGLDS